MAKKNSKADRLDRDEELLRLLAVLVRQQFETQTEFISELSKVGFPNARIAEFLDTSTDSVGATLRNLRKRGRKEPSG